MKHVIFLLSLIYYFRTMVLRAYNVLSDRRINMFRVHNSCLLFKLVPSHPPANIRVNNASTTKASCEVQWGPIPAEHQNGAILGYELLYTMTSQQAIQKSINMTVDTYSYVLTVLDSYTEYNVSIVGMTSVGKGAHSQESAVTCLTKSDC